MNRPGTLIRKVLAASWIPALVAGGMGLYAMGTGCDASIAGIYDSGSPIPQQVGMGGDVDTIFGPDGFEPMTETFLFTPQSDGTPNPADPVTLDFTDYATTCVPGRCVPQSSSRGGQGLGSTSDPDPEQQSGQHLPDLRSARRRRRRMAGSGPPRS